MAESDPPLRAIEVWGAARFIEDGVSETALRIATRYLGPKEAAFDVAAVRGADVIVRIEPSDIRIWEYLDEYSTDLRRHPNRLLTLNSLGKWNRSVSVAPCSAMKRLPWPCLSRALPTPSVAGVPCIGGRTDTRSDGALRL